MAYKVHHGPRHSSVICLHRSGGFTMSKDTIGRIQCPACQSKVAYLDEKAHPGKQRYLS